MRAFVDVSYDNFATTTRIITRFTEDQRNEAVSIPVNNPTSGLVRFHFGLINAGNEWWWAIDNVTVTGVGLSSPITAAVVTPPANGDVVVYPDCSFRYTPRPDFAGTDVFTYAATSERITTQAPVTIDVRPRPDVVAVRVNDGAPQRSQVRSLWVEFDALVNPLLLQQPGAFAVTRAGDGAAVGAVNVASSTFGSRTYAALTFFGANTNAGSLADGIGR
jgi:hypothetical protein